MTVDGREKTYGVLKQRMRPEQKKAIMTITLVNDLGDMFRSSA